MYIEVLSVVDLLPLQILSPKLKRDAQLLSSYFIIFMLFLSVLICGVR